jgi:hypothetical protein
VRADPRHILLPDAVFKIMILAVNQKGVIVHGKDDGESEEDQGQENGDRPGYGHDCVTFAFGKTHDDGDGNSDPEKEKYRGNYQIAVMILHVVRSLVFFDISFNTYTSCRSFPDLVKKAYFLFNTGKRSRFNP